jgi:hypothetical protein
VRGHADAAATDAHVNTSLGERPGEIWPQAALRAQPDHVTGALRASGGRESRRLRSRNELIRPRSQLSVDVLWRPFCDLGERLERHGHQVGLRRLPLTEPRCARLVVRCVVHQAREVVASRTMQPGFLEWLPLGMPSLGDLQVPETVRPQ